MADSFLTDTVLFNRMVTKLRLRHLRLVVALDECISLSAAARQIGISQPAATQMLRELEDLLQTALYERHSRGLSPLPLALHLATYARFALGNLREAAQAMASHARDGEPLLHVGAIPAAVSALIAPRIALIQRQMPQLRLSVVEEAPELVMAQLNAGLIQMALVREPTASVMESLRFTPLCDDKLVVVASPEHPLAGRDRITLKALEAFPWSLPVAGHQAGQAFAQACEAAGITPQLNNIQSISTRLICQLTADRRTLAAVPYSIILDLLGSGALVELALRQSIPLPRLGALHRVGDAATTIPRLLDILAGTSQG